MKSDDETPPQLTPFTIALLDSERRRPGPSFRQRWAIWRRTRTTLIAAGLLGNLWTAALSTAIAMPKGGALVMWGAVALGVGAGAVTTVRLVSDPGPARGPGHEQEGRREPSRATSQAPIPSGLSRDGKAKTQAASVTKLAPSAAPMPGELGPRHVREPGSRHVRERRLIDGARASLSGGDLAGAEKALTRHARLFARGLFEEEREALYVLTMARAGRWEQADKRAALFRQRFPDSVFRRVIEQAVRPAE